MRHARAVLAVACMGASFGFALAWLGGGVLPRSREVTAFAVPFGAVLALVSWPAVAIVAWLLERVSVATRVGIARGAAVAIASAALVLIALGARRTIARGSVADVAAGFVSVPSTMTPKMLGIAPGPHEIDGACDLTVDASPGQLRVPHGCDGLLVWRDAKRDAWLVASPLSSGAIVESWAYVGPSYERKLGWRRAFATVSGPPWGFLGFAMLGAVIAAVMMARRAGMAVAIAAVTIAPMVAAAIEGFCA